MCQGNNEKKEFNETAWKNMHIYLPYSSSELKYNLKNIYTSIIHDVKL